MKSIFAQRQGKAVIIPSVHIVAIIPDDNGKCSILLTNSEVIKTNYSEVELCHKTGIAHPNAV